MPMRNVPEEYSLSEAFLTINSIILPATSIFVAFSPSSPEAVGAISGLNSNQEGEINFR